MKKLLVVMFVVVSVSALAFAAAGYFLQSTNYVAYGVSVAAGPTSNPGPAYTMVSQALPAGDYLITARVDGQSYGPNSGAVCFFSGSGIPDVASAQYTSIDTSSNWTALARNSAVILGEWNSANDGTFKLLCQKGYLFTGASQFRASVQLVKVND